MAAGLPPTPPAPHLPPGPLAAAARLGFRACLAARGITLKPEGEALLAAFEAYLEEALRADPVTALAPTGLLRASGLISELPGRSTPTPINAYANMNGGRPHTDQPPIMSHQVFAPRPVSPPM